MEISKSAFRPIPMAYPAINIEKEFAKIADLIFERITENARRAQTLTILRDKLLPRLISGQLKLQNCNRGVGEV
jgi:type I restriction enzyme S subunit